MSESLEMTAAPAGELAATAGELAAPAVDAAPAATAYPLPPPAASGVAPGRELPRQLLPSFRRMILSVLVALAVGVGVIIVASPHLGRDMHVAQRAADHPVYLALAFLATGVVLITDAWSLLLLARVFDPGISRRDVVSTAFESHLIGGATSFGGFEIPYQIVMLRRGGLTGSQATSVVIFKGLVHTLILAGVALVSFLPWADSPITSLQRWLLLGATGLLLLVWLVAWAWLRRPLGRSLVPERFHDKLDEFVQAARACSGAGRRTILALAGLQLLYWVAMFSILIFVLHALGWRGPVVPIITGQAVMQVLMPLSPLPGGAGVAELTYLALIGPSTPVSIHISSLVLWRFFTWGIPVTVGAVSLGLRGARRVS